MPIRAHRRPSRGHSTWPSDLEWRAHGRCRGYALSPSCGIVFPNPEHIHAGIRCPACLSVIEGGAGRIVRGGSIKWATEVTGWRTPPCAFTTTHGIFTIEHPSEASSYGSVEHL